MSISFGETTGKTVPRICRIKWRPRVYDFFFKERVSKRYNKNDREKFSDTERDIGKTSRETETEHDIYLVEGEGV